MLQNKLGMRGKFKYLGLLLALVCVSNKAYADYNFEKPELVKKTKEALDIPWLDLTPSFEGRLLYLLKEDPATAGRQGLAIMQAIAGIDWVLNKKLNFIFRYDLGFLGPGVRELYFDFETDYFDNIRLGRFPLNFGFRLEDHRVYTKRYFATSYNDFETGFEFYKSFGNARLVACLVQGLNTGDSFETNKILITPCADLRVDFSLGALDFTTGLSGFKTVQLKGEEVPADSSAAATAFLKAAWKKFTFTSEVTIGHNRNNIIPTLNSFIGNPAYVATLKNQDSLGILALVEYRLFRSFNILYEFDRIIFDTRFTGDYFDKHGVGFDWKINANAEIEVRAELLMEGRTENPDLTQNNDQFLVTFHAWY